MEQAASLVQQAVHPDALTIFGATFDENMDDEIRVTVIATGFDKAPAGSCRRSAPLTSPPQSWMGRKKEEPAKATAAPTPIEPIAPPAEKEEAPKDDFDFESILKIFEHRD